MATIQSAIKYDIAFYDKFGKAAFPSLNDCERNGLRKAAKSGALHKETLIEIALAKKSKGLYQHQAGLADFTDLSDAKAATSQRKNNDHKRGSWTHSITFSNVKGKPGGLRCVGWDQYNDEWYFLAVPKKAFQHLNTPLELVLESYSNTFTEPKWGTKKTNSKWLQYRVNSFKALAEYKF